jgi:O-antigen/teichoic acid export membrane protein
LIYNLQGRVLSLLVRGGDGDAIKRLARRLLGIGVVLVALAGLVGLAVGPKVVEVLYGAEFRPAMLVAALAAAGVIAAAVTQVLSQALVAAGSTGELAGAWIGGLLVGLATMVVLPGTPDFRVAAGFVAGEIAALAIAAWRTVRRG